MIITLNQFKQIVPACPAQQAAIFVPLLTSILPAYHIDTPARIGAFIAQTAFESANYTAMTELASGNEYEGREDLGNTQKEDGPRFKGRGLIQITGRGNYEWCSRTVYGDSTLLLDAPELLAKPDGAVKSACWYWTVARPTMNAICDEPETYMHTWNSHAYTKIQWLTILINGGLNGLAQRTANYQRAQKVLEF